MYAKKENSGRLRQIFSVYYPVVRVFFSFPSRLLALALECYECTNTPGLPGVSKCDSDNIGKITCHQFLDRCVTLKYKMTIIPGTTVSVEVRNCSNSMVCDPSSSLNSKYRKSKLAAVTVTRRHRLHGHGFTCNRIAFDAFTPNSVYTAPMETDVSEAPFARTRVHL